MLQRHAGEGETIAEAIRDCLDYGKDPEKTESGKYISAYECDPATVADEFLLAKASYAAMTGREQKKENDVLCYQIRQSFYPGEITPKEANRIGYELAMRWTKGRHAFIVTTHTDKQHIHCHIYYNSTILDCTRKFRNFWGSSFALRRLSDRLCLENGLSIVENPKPRSKGKYRNYGEWQKDRKGPLSYQDRLRLAIDTALAERPADLDEFLALLDARKKLFSQLSLGMRQRLGIARAFLGDVQYLLLDEPTNGLDPMGIKEIRLLLKERLKSPQHCILVSSHNLTEIAAVTDVLIFIRDGKIIKIVENDYNEKELEALYEDIMTSGQREEA